jgi:methionine sulfoxide reductase heme-binding subunit
MAGVKYRGLDPRTRPLRWGLYVLLLAGVLVATAPAALGTATQWLATEHDKLPWYGTRLFGMLAYLAVALSVIYGLLLSTGVLDAIAHRAVSFTLHQDLAAIGIGLGMVHGALLMLDRTVPYTPAQVLVPFAGPYQPLWVGIGQIALYLMAIVYVSFYARRRIGQRAWRLLHYATFLTFLAATAHGLMAGSDTSAPWAFWTYVAASVAVAFLFGYRLTLAAAARIVRVDSHVESHMRVKPSPKVRVPD